MVTRPRRFGKSLNLMMVKKNSLKNIMSKMIHQKIMLKSIIMSRGRIVNANSSFYKQ